MRPREQVQEIVDTIPGSFVKEIYILRAIGILCETIEDASTRIAAAILHNKESSE